MKAQLMHKDDFTREIFLRLLARWDIKDKAGAQALAKASAQIAEGFTEAFGKTLDGKPTRQGALAKETTR